MSALPPVLAGRYRPIRELGRGGMGVVYVVEHVHTGEQLALKLLTAQAEANASAVERFKREARAPAQIKSDHVVRVTDADVAPELGALFLVMELLEGSDLEQLTEGRPQPPDTVVAWFRQIARGLDKAHRLGIVHRDLKPENLYLTQREDGSDLVKILDFGISKFLAEGAGAGSNPTETGNVVGTPRYMAPEQALGEVARIGPATDVWALGMTAFRFLTGRDYWTGSNVVALIGQIVYGPKLPPSERGADFGPAFDAWFQRSCERDPEKRWPSVGEQAEQLAAALKDSAPLAASTLELMGAASTLAVTPSQPVSPTGSLAGSAANAHSRPRPRARLTKLVLVLAPLAVLAVGAMAWMRAGSRTEPAQPGETAQPKPALESPAPLPAQSAAPTPTATAVVDAGAADASVDAGRRKPRGPAKPGDPLKEQY